MRRKGNRKALSGLQLGIIIAVVVIIVVAAVAAVLLIPHKPSVPVTSTTVPPSSVTFYTWWATEGKIALNHEIPAIQKSTGITLTPEIVPGAGGTNAKYAILSLIEAGKPPAAFQVHYGPEMASYVQAAPNGINSFVNLTPVAIKEGLTTNAVPAVLEAGAFNGTILSLPLNVHRGSLIWVNVNVLREYNLPFPYNLSTLQYDTMQLVDHGFTHPWMIPGADGGWDQLNVWEDIFLSLAGPQLYNEMIYGTINFNNATVQSLINETTNIFLNFTAYDYPGWQSLTWTQGLSYLVNGQVAFQVNGNWLTNYLYDFLNTTAYPPLPQYINNSSVKIIESPFPGTQHYYALVIDSVGIPVGPQESQALKVAEFWSSYQGQEVWTKWKAVTFWKNGTDWYNTPAQWYDYQDLLHTPEKDFVYQLSDGGLFDSTFGQIIGDILTLQEVGNPDLSVWYGQLQSVMHNEQQEWLAAAKLGLGYLGFKGQPFAGYYPPWVSDPSAYGLDPANMHSTAQTQGYSVLLLFPTILVPVAFVSKLYL
ncbi:glucose ABC transporter substrate-binding protein GlcS [Acidianus sp. RZ1]|uniref:glucose ABC transporter substrate-binding protein GlcS n=1 Tax=Acidianus sp. RZ1 TaxID=1540082 RepID=UPI001492D639|nr:glucose ABC transporter substrate-binding protein GlcS [Acidianus sp. RZ1]NON61549.1 carbohydrate ABC transporter substrate-binding protein [Acidianus sp. RZ1]